MSFRSGLSFVVLFLLTLVPLAARAQQPSAAAPTAQAGASVHGLVTDPDDALIPNATVTLTSAGGKALTATSKSDGTYTFRGVPSGSYIVTVTAPGFAAFVKEGVRVGANASLALDAKMVIEAESQQMTVRADSVTLSVDPENNASSTVISGTALDALSDDPDELSTELTALAGPAAGPSGGQIYIDGFTGGQLPPKSSIREIRINSNPFSAQFDQLGYGRIEVFTKPGTDKFHGNFSTQFGDKFLNTSTPFLGAANSQPNYHTLFFTGSVTGPIRTGMSFTLAGSHRNIDNNAIINPTSFYANSPASTTLCAPGDLTCTSYAFPTTARALAEPQTRWDIAPRIDVALGSKNTLTARFQYEQGTSRINPTINSALLTTGSNTDSSESEIQISDTQLISSKVINETRFEYQHTTSDSTPLSTSPFVSVQGVFSAGGSTGGVNHSPGDHIEVQNYTSIQLQKNFVRLGGRLRTSGVSIYSTGGTNGSFTYSFLLDPCVDPTIASTSKPNCIASPNLNAPCSTANMVVIPVAGSTPAHIAPLYSSYQCSVPDQYDVTTLIHPTITARETDVGLYAEDDWKARSNLTISYGIRLEAQNKINSGHDFAPRVSVAYGVPRKNGKTTTVLRGGFGIFYNRFGLSSISSQVENNGQNQTDFVYESPGGTNSPCSPATPSNCATGTSSASSRTSVQTLDVGGLRSAYTIQSAATIEQQVGKYTSISATYLNARGEHQYLSREFPGATILNFQSQSGGVFRQNQINTNVNIRTPKGISLFGFYAASWANSNISNVTDPYNPRTDYGRASFAVRSRLTVGGSVALPYHFTASPLLFANSGQPYNLTTGEDQNQDSQKNDRPEFAPGATSKSCLNAANFFSPSPVATYTAGGENYAQVPVNFCTGPANVTFNLRLSRTFGFGPKTEAALAAAARAAQGGGPGGGGFGGGPGGGGPGGGGGGRGGGGAGGGGGGGRGGGGGGSNTGRKYNLTVGAFAQNLFNEIPYGNQVSTLTSSRFGQSTSLQGGIFASQNAVRRITLQASFNF